MNRDTRLTAIAFLLLLPTALMSQEIQTRPDVLTNKSIVEMVAAKLPEDVIIAKIQGSSTNFDVSTTGLVDLNNNGVPSNVVKAMLAPKSSSEPTTVPPPPKLSDANDPSAQHDAGIYMYVKKSDRKELIQLEPTVYSQGKSGGMFQSAMTYGIAKIKWKAVVRSAHSNVKTTDPNGTFYFYFEERGAGLSYSGFGTSTPNEFTLLKFEVKKDTRETEVMSANAFGSQSGTQEKSTIQFTFQKLRPGVYKVTPSAPLKPGEYCFLSASAGGAYAPGAAAATRLFDFSIIPAE